VRSVRPEGYAFADLEFPTQSSKVSPSVGAIMKELRILAAVTLQDAANVIGVAHSTIRQAEMGRACLTIVQIRTLIEFYAPEVQRRLNVIQELFASETVNSDLPAENLRGATKAAPEGAN